MEKVKSGEKKKTVFFPTEDEPLFFRHFFEKNGKNRYFRRELRGITEKTVILFDGNSAKVILLAVLLPKVEPDLDEPAKNFFCRLHPSNRIVNIQRSSVAPGGFSHGFSSKTR